MIYPGLTSGHHGQFWKAVKSRMDAHQLTQLCPDLLKGYATNWFSNRFQWLQRYEGPRGDQLEMDWTQFGALSRQLKKNAECSWPKALATKKGKNNCAINGSTSCCQRVLTCYHNDIGPSRSLTPHRCGLLACWCAEKFQFSAILEIKGKDSKDCMSSAVWSKCSDCQE